MTQHHKFIDGERVLFFHCDGYIPAKIERVCEGIETTRDPLTRVQKRKRKPGAILRIKGWLGTHWFPLDTLQPDLEGVGGKW